MSFSVAELSVCSEAKSVDDIDGRKRIYYSDNILVRIEPGIHEAVAEAAPRENTTMAEIIRRGLRAALAAHGRLGLAACILSTRTRTRN